MLISNSNNFFLQKNNLDYEVVALNSPFDRRNEYFEFRVIEGNKPLKNFRLLFLAKMVTIFIRTMSKRTQMEKEK